MPLEPGDKAPDFTLLDQDGQPFTLSKSLEERKVPHFVYFFPKADTPGCTQQACGLRDAADRLAGTVVVGVSPDPPERQARFDRKYGLGFPLLSDEDHAVAEAYGAWGEKTMYGKRYMGVFRSALLLDEEGKVAAVWPKISPGDTATNLLRTLGV